MITIYTDGSSRGNPGPGGWGAIIITHDDSANGRIIELGDSETHTTNNRMELVACIRAIKFIIDNLTPSSIQVNTDSEYVMKGITLWIKNWQKKGWKTAGKKAVLNQDLWQELLLVTEGQDIEWRYVAGHAGVAANERCDEIATSFADGMEVQLYNGSRAGYQVSL